ncbi:MAG: 2-succinyl-5-enolpyruvyl-6-hydroxy-3-cyclohexene-1-carboxylic-acid synthase [Deltaproteobacteria bacterium]|nr:2-succinyl-5-enolpyruvyl-6-hydroxy-3-cyclohexene-1-carboxylic-acid synthase [Deltaproteobacteria bacterium]
MPSPAEVTYAWAATVLDALAGGGVRDVVICPGARSAPLALCADAHGGLRTFPVVDERSGAFLALGLALSSRRPAAMICTSGTAGANAYPAVIEAAMSHVPMVIITADRPPELHGCGALQTIPQVPLFGAFADCVDLPPPDVQAAYARVRISGALAHATAAGRVLHVNVPLREPLAPETGPLPRGSSASARHFVTAPAQPADLASLTDILAAASRPVVVAGPRRPDAAFAAAAQSFAAALAAPVLAEATSGLRFGPHATSSIAHYEALLRVPSLGEELRPDVIVRVGGPVTTRCLQSWVDLAGATVITLADPGRVCDPARVSRFTVEAEPTAVLDVLARTLARGGTRGWWERWMRLDAVATEVLSAELPAAAPCTEPSLARTVMESVPGGAALFVSSSMPIRDLDAFVSRRSDPVDVFASRGASGIDGIVSTAFGVAAGSGRRTVLFTGDTAFLHDVGGLAWGARLRIPLCIVVVNNAGGRIFEFLPVASATTRLNELFVMPHGVDLAHAAALAGARLHRPATGTALTRAVQEGLEGGVHVVEVQVDPSRVRADHDAAFAAVRRAVERAP